MQRAVAFIKKTVVLTLAYALVSCSSSIKIVPNTNHLSGVNQQEPTYVYALPKTHLKINIQWTETQYTKAPYADFSEDLIHLKPLVESNHKQYEITGITTETQSLADKSRSFLIEDKKQEISTQNLNQILKSAFVELKQNAFVKPNVQTEPFVFRELSLSKSIIQEDKKGYKLVKEDSITKRIPVTNKIVRHKTLEEMAKDAAKTLLKIRKRKFRIMGALNTNPPDGMAVKEMLRALDEKERYYESLFLGHISQAHFQKTITIDVDKLGRYLLCYFDAEKGLVADKTSGNPVWLTISKKEKTQNAVSQEGAKEDGVQIKHQEGIGFPYLLPEYSDIEIVWNDVKMYQTKVIFPQFNQIHYMPIHFLKKNKLIINPSKGTIEAIQ